MTRATTSPGGRSASARLAREHLDGGGGRAPSSLAPRRALPQQCDSSPAANTSALRLRSRSRDALVRMCTACGNSVKDATSNPDAAPNPDAAADAATGDTGDAGKADGACSAATPEEACGNPACRSSFWPFLPEPERYLWLQDSRRCPTLRGWLLPPSRDPMHEVRHDFVHTGRGAELCESFRFG